MATRSDEFISDYKILEILGSGAVGTAYRAEHRKTGAVVALKLMHERLATVPDVQNRFVREVSVLAKLAHPNIVRHLDSGIDDGRLYSVMEWVEYGALSEVLERRTTLRWREAVECAIQICDGLEHAHKRGVIHRDLKPENLFLSADGHVKIGDFGLARDADLHRLTIKGNTVGSCRYMAPEQIRGEDALTGAVDMYALGCLIFQMLTGSPPYDGPSIIEIFEQHLFDDVPPLPPARDGRPEALEELIMLLLSKDAATRPREASEVRMALAEILAGRPVALPTPPPPIPDENQPPVEPNLTLRLVQDENDENEKRHVTGQWWPLFVVVGVVLVMGVIWFLTIRGG